MRIRIEEPHLTIHHDYAVLISESDGCFVQPSERGLFFRDTRIVSRWTLTANGQPWELLNSANEAYCAARIVLTNPPIGTESGEIDPHTLQLSIRRALGPGLHEDFDLRNFGTSRIELSLAIEIDSDFADFFEVKSHKTFERPRIVSAWSDAEQSLSTSYRHGGFSRGVVVRLRNTPIKAHLVNGKIAFDLRLQPGEDWHCCLLYELIDGDERFCAPQCHGDGDVSNARSDDGSRQLATVQSGSDEFNAVVHQAMDDMIGLRLHVPGTHGMPIVAGGVPWFLSLFGRDSIIASLQYQMVDAEFSHGVLERLAEFQADRQDDYRDAEPGKIPHELRHGELAFFKKIPHTPYYGSADATPLYLILLHAAWKCTGDEALLRERLATAERCLDWIDDYGDRDGDGFQEYQTRSSAGYENQSWKDAGDAILYPDGTLVKGPKALCELQGYVFDAWLRMAEVFAHFGDAKRASELRRKAKELYRRFNERFWNEEAGFYALTLDGDKQAVMSIASNPGHCLWSGIVPRERAARVVARLMQKDMWSGWGVRTLSAGHAVYNPFSYQNGSIWPHDNSVIAMGMRRYGFVREACTLARALCEAATYFASARLPELFAGTERELGFPIRYLGSNVPQAWATGTPLYFLQMVTGFAPDAPNNRLDLDPALPDWLPELTVRDLQVGPHRLDLRFWRDGERTRFVVEKNDGGVDVRQHPLAVPADAFGMSCR